MGAGDNEMVQHLYVDKRESFLQIARQQLVGLARLGRPRRVVVSEDYCGGIGGEGSLDDFARVDARLGQRAANRFLKGNDPVLCVEPEADENLVFPASYRQ